MARNDSTNGKLFGTSDQRASLKDLNGARPNNFLNSYLERITEDVKVPRHHVQTIQRETEYLASQFDGSISYMKGSSVFHSKKGSFDMTQGVTMSQ